MTPFGLRLYKVQLISVSSLTVIKYSSLVPTAAPATRRPKAAGNGERTSVGVTY